MKNLTTAIAVSAALFTSQASAQNVASLSDVEMAHVAYTADNIDIRYAHLALALSSNPDIHGIRKYHDPRPHSREQGGLGFAGETGSNSAR